MWSLYERDNAGNQGIFNFSGKKLEPLKFSNDKTQSDVVKEIFEAIKEGYKIIFIKGACGTGKSAIALNLAKHFPKTSIVVPIKSLQQQYEQDYMRKKFVLKDNKEKLKISMIKGRNNFSCPFEENKVTTENSELPCTIEIREKNKEKIKEYLKMNNFVSENLAIDEIKRMSIAPACPYWSPLFPGEVLNPVLDGAKKIRYKAVWGKNYALYQRKKGCMYYDQYENYATSDVLIFNSKKYIIETLIGRKPKTQLDVIDECDEFLDSLAEEKTINLNRLLSALSGLTSNIPEDRAAIKKLTKTINELLYDFSLEDVERLKKTPVLDLVEEILDNPYLAEDEEENYYNHVFESLLEFENFLDETYISVDKEKKAQSTLFGDKDSNTVYINFVTINLAKRFQEIIDKDSVLVLMSGTIHSEQVLKNIFGLDKFKMIEAETNFPGVITKKRLGLEENCKYENFKAGKVTREKYLQALSSCVKGAKTPVLIHVNSFEDLPNESEKKNYKVENLITKENLIKVQSKINQKSEVEKFKAGEIDILFTTKCSRGIDFPGEQCNSIIFTKYPYPNISSLFWKILRKEKPEEFMEFYLDKAKRELIQKIYRGLRFRGDHIILMSPDSRVLNENLGKIQKNKSNTSANISSFEC